jgi:protein-L-isoaspartate(D-aspartate) O-methyltransferase
MLDEKEKMIKHLKVSGIQDEKLLHAMNLVPRENFVLPENKQSAYADRALEIDFEQTISQPYIVALMIQEARITQNSRVLDIGTGSGYAAAVLSRLAAEVYTIEVLPKLSKKAEKINKALGYNNIVFKIGNGRLGLEGAAPFDAILVAACSESVPKSLLIQLALNGRLIIPLGDKTMQSLYKITKISDNKFSREKIELVRFVPLIH